VHVNLKAFVVGVFMECKKKSTHRIGLIFEGDNRNQGAAIKSTREMDSHEASGTTQA
jgi:hypothetical protein